MKRVQVIAVSTAPSNDYQKLQKQTAKALGYSYRSIGQGKPWNGFVTKMTLPIEFLEKELENYQDFPDQYPNPNETLYTFVDAYDLAFVGPPSEMLKKYETFGTSIVVGAERVCFGNCQPVTCDSSLQAGERQYINTGMVMGNIHSLLKYYHFGKQNYPADDQIAMSKLKNIECDLISLDKTASIIFNFPFTRHQHDTLEKISNGRFKIKGTDVQPCLVHCPFIFQDLGKRWDFVLEHIILDYKPTRSKTQLFHELVKYSTKTIRTNKSYFVFTISVMYGIVLFAIAIIYGIVYALQYGQQALIKYEKGK